MRKILILILLLSHLCSVARAESLEQLDGVKLGDSYQQVLDKLKTGHIVTMSETLGVNSEGFFILAQGYSKDAHGCLRKIFFSDSQNELQLIDGFRAPGLNIKEQCFGYDYLAEYFNDAKSIKISIGLNIMHPWLAEYQRDLIITSKDNKVLRFKLRDDTGGYSDEALYQCGDSQFVLTNDVDSYIIDVNQFKISVGLCTANEIHIGGFKKTHKGWAFYPVTNS